MNNYKEIALGVLQRIENTITEIINDYPIKDKLLDNGAIYYMNSNDGTIFDWEANDRLCEFFVFHNNEAQTGFIKLCLDKEGIATIYIYEDGGKSPTEHYAEEICGEDDAQYLACLMYFSADRNYAYDENIENIDFDAFDINELFYLSFPNFD